MYYNDNEMTLLYNNNKSYDRKVYAMAVSRNLKINLQDLSSMRIAETLFMMFLDKLKVNPEELVNKSLPIYESEIEGKNLNEHDWYELITHHPDLLRVPIAMHKGKAIICNSTTDLFKIS
jgi:arsenate reductase-like glutaredoxin family protein